MMLEYTYPDGLGAGGTFTDGDQFSQETIQTIIDNVVATTKADTEQRIIKLLEPHRITGKSVGGFLGVCSCGEAIDDYQLHLIALIKGENK